MEAENGLENDYFDEATHFVSEAREKYAIPGFVHQPPRPTVVLLKNILLSFFF